MAKRRRAIHIGDSDVESTERESLSPMEGFVPSQVATRSHPNEDISPIERFSNFPIFRFFDFLIFFANIAIAPT
jgi:hypothetical protein